MGPCNMHVTPTSQMNDTQAVCRPATNTPTHILSKLYARLLQTVPGGPLTLFHYLVDTMSVALDLAHLTRETMPGHSMQCVTTHVAVGGTRMCA